MLMHMYETGTRASGQDQDYHRMQGDQRVDYKIESSSRFGKGIRGRIYTASMANTIQSWYLV